MSSAVVRVALPSDLLGVLRLYKELRPHDPVMSGQRLENLWRDVNDGERSIIVVAEVGGEVAATCMLATVANLASDGRRIALIEHVVTARQFRQMGLASKVLKFALDRAWAVPCSKVLLLSGVQRAEAHRLYESVGFRGDVERGFVIKPPMPG